MANNNMLQLCRLCLVKDDVNIPIFEDQGDIRQIFLKISSCLPVKVARDDRLPKKICDGCSYKLDMLYEFWNTSANAEKQLLSWLGEAGVPSKMADGTLTAVAQQMKPAEAFVKEETLEPPDGHADDDDKDYLFEQQKVEESTSAGPSATVTSNDDEEPPPKRARRTAAVKAAIAMDQDSDDDDDSGEPLTKIEDESEDSEGDEDDHVPAFVDVPSTSADDQPGPSGVGKDGVEAPRERPTKCPLCNKPCSDNPQLSRHLQTHRPKTISCDFCPKKFLHQNVMLKHKHSVHLSAYTHECPTCGATFKTALSLKQHVQRLHEKNYTSVCEQCGKGYFKRWQLELHRKVEHQDARFHCPTCQRPFKSRFGLRKHEAVHDPLYVRAEKARPKREAAPRRFVCDVCGKVVNSRDSLAYHKRTHTGEKPFVCEHCGRAFGHTKLLAIHLRVHTGEKPFVCEVCLKGFSQKSALSYHRKTHTGEKPYQCGECDKNFITGTKLRTHKCVKPD